MAKKPYEPYILSYSKKHKCPHCKKAIMANVELDLLRVLNSITEHWKLNVWSGEVKDGKV